MKKGKVVLLLLVALIFLGSILFVLFEKMDQKQKIYISTNPWVGYTPFAYAYEKGWFKDSGFEFIWLSDLSDNARLYERDFTQGFLATQYELLNFTNKKDIIPIFLIDRSSGADAVVSNYTIDELKNYNDIINVYLEQGSTNRNLFEAFIKEYQLEALKFKLIEADQREIVTQKNTQTPKIAISYHPYISLLYKNGFKNIASTKDLKTFFAIDALFANKNIYLKNIEEFKKLQDIFILAVKQLQNNPKEYYETIKPYLEGESYEEFMSSLELIKWLYNDLPKQEIEYLKNQNIDTSRLKQ